MFPYPPLARQLAEHPALLLVGVEAGAVVGALGVVLAVDHALLHQHQSDLVLQAAALKGKEGERGQRRTWVQVDRNRTDEHGESIVKTLRVDK